MYLPKFLSFPFFTRWCFSTSERGTEETDPIGSLSVGCLPAPSPDSPVSGRGHAPVGRPEGGGQVFGFLLRHKTRKRNGLSGVRFLARITG